MKEKNQRNLYRHLNKNGINNFVGVPDSTMKYFIDEGLQKKQILIATREEEAIGIAAGIAISNYTPLVFMQNAGFANSISTITSLIQLYEIPIIFLIGWRGYMKNDAPEHLKIGKIQPKLLNTIDLDFKIITDMNWQKSIKWAIKKINNSSSCALIIRREFND